MSDSQAGAAAPASAVELDGKAMARALAGNAIGETGAGTPEEFARMHGLDPDQFAELCGMLGAVSLGVVPALRQVPPAPDAPAAGAPGRRPFFGGGRGRDELIDPNGAFALRTRLRCTQDLVRNARDMYVGAVKLEQAVAAHNALGRAMAPKLFGDIDAFASKAKIPPAEAIRLVLDTRVDDPSLAPLRGAMATLAATPEMEASRRNLAVLSRDQNDTTHRVAETIRVMARDLGPEAVEKLGQDLAATVGKKIDGMPGLQVETPGDKPNGMLASVKETFRNLSEQIKQLVQGIVDTVRSVFTGR